MNGINDKVGALKADMGAAVKVMVSALNEKVGAVEKSLKADVGAVKESLKADVGAMEKSLKADVGAVEKSLAAEMSSLKWTVRSLLGGLLLVFIFRPLAEPLVKKGSEVLAKTLD
jgi:hypothetical protein